MDIQGDPAPAPGSFSVLPSIPNPIRGAAGRLRSTLSTLNGCVGGAIAAAPYSPTVLIGGGMSVVRGLGAMCEEWREPAAELQGDAQRAKVTNAQGIVSHCIFVAPALLSLRSLQFNGGVSTLCGTIFGDTMKVASLVQDLIMLPLRFAAGLQPLGQKATIIADMLTNENVGLAQIHEEIITKNINNITKLTLVAAIGSGGLMAVSFLGAVVGLVFGLSMIPVFCSLSTLLVLGLLKSKHTAKSPVVLDVPPPTDVLPPVPKNSRSFFL